MLKPDFTNPKFWKELRKRTSLDGRIGEEECYYWCYDALKLLSEYGAHGFKIIDGTLPRETVRKYSLFMDDHRVLAREYPSGIFIADGTAGQVNKRYPEGYYGYSINAPRKLKLFYDDAIRRWKEK